MGSLNKYRVSYKRCLLLSFFFIAFPFFIQAQSPVVTDSIKYRTLPATKPHRSGDDVFNDIKGGVIIPQGTFGQHITNPGGSTYNLNNLSLPFQGKDGLGATYGYDFQYEGFSAFGKPHSGTSFNAHVGFQYGFEFGYVPVSWNNVQWSNYNMTVGTSQFIYIGLKFGPAIYLNPTKDMGLGFYALIDPELVIPGEEYATSNTTDASGNTTVTAYYLQDSSSAHFSIDASAGVNFYYKAFIIGVEYNWVHTKYNGAITENNLETKNGVTTTPSTYTGFGDVIQTNMLKLTFGIRLGYGCKHRYDEENQ